MADEFTIDSAEFKVFYKAMTNVDVEIKKSLRKRLMDAAKPIVEEVKQAELALPSKREAGETRKKKGATLGLRASLANATKSDFNGTGKGAAVHIRVSTTKFMAVSGRPRTIPYYVDGRKSDWRHPIYGRRALSEDWARQKATPFLGVTIIPHKEEFAREVTDAVMDALAAVTPIK